MNPTDPIVATIAAIEHYERRAIELNALAHRAPLDFQPTFVIAIDILNRARRAELIDPPPAPQEA